MGRHLLQFVAGFVQDAGLGGWSAFPVQSHMRWGIVPGEFDKMPAALVVGGKASRRDELVNQLSTGKGIENRDIQDSSCLPG